MQLACVIGRIMGRSNREGHKPACCPAGRAATARYPASRQAALRSSNARQSRRAVMGLALLWLPLTLAAGPVTRAAESAAARRAAAQVAKQAAERAAWQRVHQQGDVAAMRAIERRFGAHLAVKGDKLPPARLLTPEEFDVALRQRAPDLSAEERRRILGYYVDGELAVNVRQQEFLLTLTHERLHQFAHTRFRSTFGSSVDEGVTERFARMSVGDLHLMDIPPVYTQEMRIADALIARVGPDRLASAYFKGDIAPVMEVLQRDLGSRGYWNLGKAMRDDDAELVLRMLVGQ